MTNHHLTTPPKHAANAKDLHSIPNEFHWFLLIIFSWPKTHWGILINIPP